jgi:hypothetical protein
MIMDLCKWNRSINMIDRSHEIRSIDDALVFQGRPVIRRDTRINGGVYLGANAREAVVVDFEKDREIMALYEKVLSAAEGRDEEGILQAVFDKVSKSFSRRSSRHVEQLVDWLGLGNDQKVLLGMFVREKTGCCRHSALACGAIIEKLIDEGYLKGKVSVDRNSFNILSYNLAHAWCRYTSAEGRVTVLDVAKDYIGGLTKKGDIVPWEYKRHEEQKEKYAAGILSA